MLNKTEGKKSWKKKKRKVLCEGKFFHKAIRKSSRGIVWDRSGQCPIQYLRLVFTSDGVVVGVVIRSVERYDLVKIKPTESEAEH